MTRKRAINPNWWGNSVLAALFARKGPFEVDDVTDTARAVAYTDALAPALIQHEGLIWRNATPGPAPLDTKVIDIAYNWTTRGGDDPSEFVASGENLYRRCLQEPSLAITYNAYHDSLRLTYPELVYASGRAPSDPPDVYFRLDEYAEASAFFDEFSRRIPMGYAAREPQKYRIAAPELLGHHHLQSTLGSLLPTIIAAFHRRMECLPHHMIQDWLALRASSSLPEEQVDTDELAALLGRLSQSGFDLIERGGDRYGRYDWLTRASQYALMMQLRLQPTGASSEAIDMLSEIFA